MEKEELLEVGQWVQLTGVFRIINGHIGFVEAYSDKHEMYYVRFVKTSDGVPIKEKGYWVENENLVSLDAWPHLDDITELINMALDMGDKGWFEELTNMLKPQEMPW